MTQMVADTQPTGLSLLTSGALLNLSNWNFVCPRQCTHHLVKVCEFPGFVVGGRGMSNLHRFFDKLSIPEPFTTTLNSAGYSPLKSVYSGQTSDNQPSPESNGPHARSPWCQSTGASHTHAFNLR